VLLFVGIERLLFFKIELVPAGPAWSRGQGGFMLPAIIATWVTAMLASMLGLAAPELEHMAQQVSQEAAVTTAEE
jgi:hypothetical protein